MNIIKESGVIFLHEGEYAIIQPGYSLNLRVYGLEGSCLDLRDGSSRIHAYGSVTIISQSEEFPQITLHQRTRAVCAGGHIYAHDDSEVIAMKDTRVEATDDATIYVHGTCKSTVTGRVLVQGFDMSVTEIVASEFSHVRFRGRNSALVDSRSAHTLAVLTGRSMAQGVFEQVSLFDKSTLLSGRVTRRLVASDDSRIPSTLEDESAENPASKEDFSRGQSEPDPSRGPMLAAESTKDLAISEHEVAAPRPGGTEHKPVFSVEDLAPSFYRSQLEEEARAEESPAPVTSIDGPHREDSEENITYDSTEHSAVREDDDDDWEVVITSTTTQYEPMDAVKPPTGETETSLTPSPSSGPRHAAQDSTDDLPPLFKDLFHRGDK